ncbi:MAG: hypothetical protein VX899_24250 [Myxococcota bacterium]|nr:hypothetical protein [Myxococcota bacterium]
MFAILMLVACGDQPVCSYDVQDIAADEQTEFGAPQELVDALSATELEGRWANGDPVGVTLSVTLGQDSAELWTLETGPNTGWRYIDPWSQDIQITCVEFQKVPAQVEISTDDGAVSERFDVVLNFNGYGGSAAASVPLGTRRWDLMREDPAQWDTTTLRLSLDRLEAPVSGRLDWSGQGGPEDYGERLLNFDEISADTGDTGGGE